MTTNTQRQLVFVHCKQNDQKSIIKQTYVRKILIVWTNLQFQGQLASVLYLRRDFTDAIHKNHSVT